MGSDLNILEAQFWAVNDILNKLLNATNATAVLLIDKAGQLITSAGNTSTIDLTAFASLAAADFAATSQLALLIGEKEFSTLFHQGERESLYVCMVESRVILVVIFNSTKATLGLVRVKANQASTELSKIFRAIFEQIERQMKGGLPGLGEDFTQEAESEIDNLFK